MAAMLLVCEGTGVEHPVSMQDFRTAVAKSISRYTLRKHVVQMQGRLTMVNLTARIMTIRCQA